MMFVILGYDVGAPRVNKVHRTVQKYLFPVQKSLFQGHLTERQLRQLQNELASLLLPSEDKAIVYKTPGDGVPEIDELGILTEQEMIL